MGNGNCNKCEKCKCNNCEMEEKNVNITNNIIDRNMEIIRNDSYESFQNELNKDNIDENNKNKIIQVSKIENEKNTTNNQEIITDNKKDKEKIEQENNNSINVNDKIETINNTNIICNEKENKIGDNSGEIKLEKENVKINSGRGKTIQKSNEVIKDINDNFQSFKKLELIYEKEEEKENNNKNKKSNTKPKINKTRNNIDEFEIIDNDIVYLSNKNKLIDNTTNTKDDNKENNNECIKEDNKHNFINNNENTKNISKIIDIKRIIPEEKISKLNENSIICNSTLEKIIKIPSKNKITYNERFCLLTKKKFSYYKSKECYLKMNKPLLSIDLKNVKKIEQTILDDTSYYFGLICVINDNTKQFIDKINTFISEGENSTEEFLLGFRSKNKDLVVKWIVILNYLIGNYE
mgnify:CR=1 FL=1